jgi:hypothetical protein
MKTSIKHKLTRAGWCAAVAALLALAPAAQGQDCNLVLNGSFEQPEVEPGGFQCVEEIPGWSLYAGDKFEIWNSNLGYASHSGEQHIELDDRSMRQVLSTTVGQEYRITFAYAARPGAIDNHIQAYWDGDLVADIQLADPGPPSFDWQVGGSTGTANYLDWKVYTVTVEATNPHTLFTLAGVGIDPLEGMQVDSVAVEHLARATPRIGAGVNPGVLTSVTPPVLGTTWTVDLDCQHAWGVAYFFVKSAPDPGTATRFGEVLVGGLPLTRPLMQVHMGNTTTFDLALPNELSYCGRSAYTQVVCLGNPVEMSNALDVVWGQ